MKLNHIDHQSKHVFVGIDVHKKTYSVCVQGQHLPAPVRLGNLVADPHKLAQKLLRTFPGAHIHSAYEAGFSGFHLHRCLVSQGIQNIVVNPASIAVAANDRVKTDPRDAFKLSHYLASGLLQAIRIPSQQEQLARLYGRTRKQLVDQRTRVSNQIKARLHEFGLIEPDDERLVSLSFLRELAARPLADELAFCLSMLADIYRTLTSKINELEEKMAEQAAQDPREPLYRSVPGVGPISARVLANELGDMSQFSNQRALYAFIGLTPTEHSSGGCQRRGHITRKGRAYLRAILVEVAWRSLDKDPLLRTIYEQLKCRVGGKRAIVAVARRLIGRIRGCFQTKQLYQLNYSSKTYRQAS